MPDAELLDEVVRAILTDVDPRAMRRAQFDATVWERLRDAGLHNLLVPETVGGPGATFRDLAVVLRAAGSSAAAVPIGEANLAASVLAEAGSSLPEGLLTLAIADDRPDRLACVPYAEAADHVVFVRPIEDGRADVHCLALAGVELDGHVNLAGEPRDRIRLATHAGDVVGTIRSAWDVRVRAAACRALLLSGAVERVRDLTVRYAHEREQFGRSLSRFQAVQQMMVETIVVSETARSITAEMATALSAGDAKSAAPLVAAARATTGRAATVATRFAHQVHGAIGFTVEHPLQASTRRLMAWRDEDGTELMWSRWLGQYVRQMAGRMRPWELITSATHPSSTLASGAAS